jgi:hypothetical protein
MMQQAYLPYSARLLELTQHIPPRGLQYIRRYGLYASRTKGKWSNMPHVMRLAPAGWKSERLQPLDPVFERALAGEGLSRDQAEWPEY